MESNIWKLTHKPPNKGNKGENKLIKIKYQKIIFATKFNSWKTFALSETSDQIPISVQVCQSQVFMLKMKFFLELSNLIMSLGTRNPIRSKYLKY